MQRSTLNSRLGRAITAIVPLLMVVSGACYAQEQPEAPDYVQVTDDGALVVNPVTAARWAMERNTDLRIQQQAVPEAEGQLQQARAADAVTVDLSGSAAKMGPVSTFELPGGEDGETRTVEVGQDQSYQVAVSARKPLYTGGRIGTSINLAQESIASARQSIDAATLSVTLGAQEAAYGVLRADQLSAVAAARVTALAEHVRDAEMREEAGVAPHFDVVQARTELARAQEDLISAQTGVEQGKAALRRALALPQGQKLMVVDPPPPVAPEGETDELIDEAWGARPEVQAAQTGVRMARLSLQLARKAKKPTLALTGQYARQSAGGLSAETESWQIALVAEKSILDGGAREGQVQSAQARLDSAELQLQRTKEEIGLEVVQQTLAAEEARKRIETAQQALVEARERRRMAQLRYSEGIAAGIEVIDADTALAAADASLVNAQYDLQLSVTRLRKALGMVDLAQQEGETQ